MSVPSDNQRCVLPPAILSAVAHTGILSDIPLASVIKALAQEEASSGHRTVEEGSHIAFVIVGLDLERLQ